MPKFFKVPFANTGDTAPIPNDVQVDGSVSYEQGYPEDYQKPESDPTKKDVERDLQNGLFKDITENIQQYQTRGFPSFITTADNEGTPYSYGKNAYVEYDPGTGMEVYYSLVDSNTSLPTDSTKWARVQFSLIPTGVGFDYWLSDLPSGGYLWADGKTIGNASSGATALAAPAAEALFIGLWNSATNTNLPLQDSSGTPVARGANAAADWAANRRLSLPDKRGRGSVGKDDMGGTAANRVTTGGSNISGSSMAAAGGVQNVQLTDTQNGPHTHSVSGSTSSDGLHNHGPGIETTGVGTTIRYETSGTNYRVAPTMANAGLHTHTVTGTAASSGLGEAHQNMQPSIVCNYIIKL